MPIWCMPDLRNVFSSTGCEQRDIRTRMTSPLHGTTLVLGGARSGKSSFAERLAAETGLVRHYIATGRAFDDEMRTRIDAHKTSRGELWTTHEEPFDLSGRLAAVDAVGCVVLVDCLTLWVTNLMLDERDIAAESERLVASLPALRASVIFVSNEVGLGIVPDNRMARDFRDHAGRLHQEIAAQARDVYFVAAGLPLKMKG
ncbi:adenosylcobinamide kinase /adenosylcobinamide-phosphate guanylyltransferase [Rhizobium sp. NFR03]|nr:adenosylcobinamide kinase /adenosylcobinamide-phosphate guanylyltransferase [Rhizobium sp. NFR03]